MSILRSRIRAIIYEYAETELQIEELEREIKILSLNYLVYANTKLGIFEELKDTESYHATKYLELFDKFIEEYYV